MSNHKKSLVGEFLENFKIKHEEKLTIKPNYVKVHDIYKAKYSIAPEQEKEFLKLLGKDIFVNKKIFHIAMQRREKDCFRVDIDLSLPQNSDTIPNIFDTAPKTKLEYTVLTDDVIEQIMHIYINELKEMYGPLNGHIVYILRKTPYTKNINNMPHIREGVHIEIPTIIDKREVFKYIRELVLPKLKIGPFKNYADNIETIVDKASITNPWMIYGCRKQDKERLHDPYLIKWCYDIENKCKIPCPIKDVDLPLHMTCIDKTPIKLIKEIPAPIENVPTITNIHYNPINTTIDDQKLEIIWDCLDSLSEERYSNYHNWRDIGFILAGISNKDPRVYQLWLRFSQKIIEVDRSKFSAETCYKIWQAANINQAHYTMGSLYHYVSTDAPEKYAEITRKDVIYQIITHSSVWEHDDVAKIVYMLYKDRYKVTFQQKTKWTLYEFKNHIWNELECDVSLNLLLSSSIRKIFGEAQKIANNKATNMQTENDNDKTNSELHKIYEQKASSLATIIKKLGNVTYKNNIIRECINYFYDEGFLNKLNSNYYLFAFNNGVYDLRTSRFRDGLPSDYISVKAPVDYKPFDPNDDVTKDMLQFFEDVYPDKELREYVLTMIASCLHGTKSDSKIYILYGSGSNGKSKLVDLIIAGFGNDKYYITLNIAYFVQKRSNSNSATNELVKVEYKRIICSSEANIDERFNLGIAKDFTGGNPIMIRGNFEKFRPLNIQGRLFMQVNHLPKVDSVDKSVSRRFRVIPHVRSFLYEDDPDYNPKNPNHKLIDETIVDKIPVWAPIFMSYLIEIYKKNIKNNQHIYEPKMVKDATRQYLNQNNLLQKFIDTNLVRSNNELSQLNKTQLYTAYKTWCDSILTRSDRRYSIDELFNYIRTALKEHVKDDVLYNHDLAGNNLM